MPARFGPNILFKGIEVFAIPAIPNVLACEKIKPPPKTMYPSMAKFAAIIQRYVYELIK